MSIPSNLAEGHARESTKEFLHHISFARGSIAELETQLLLGIRLGFITEEHTQATLQICDELGRMLNGMQRSLRRKALNPNP